MNQTEPNISPQRKSHRITPASMLRHLPGASPALASPSYAQDLVVQFYSHRTVADPILVPVVVEPLLVLVLSGEALVEERSLGGNWETVYVQSGDFFLTNTREPYEMRWQTQGGDTFQVMHIYMGLPYIERAASDLLGRPANNVVFQDVSGGRDELIVSILSHLRRELTDELQPSQLLIRSMAQALAVHLVRTYIDRSSSARPSNALQAYKLRRVIDEMNRRLAEDFSLSHLAQVAQLSEYHFSRMFKRTTGLSPSQFFIRLRMSRAKELLRDTDRSVIDIGLEIGYSSPSHFSQVFRREVGLTPSAYRQI